MKLSRMIKVATMFIAVTNVLPVAAEPLAASEKSNIVEVMSKIGEKAGGFVGSTSVAISRQDPLAVSKEVLSNMFRDVDYLQGSKHIGNNLGTVYVLIDLIADSTEGVKGIPRKATLDMKAALNNCVTTAFSGKRTGRFSIDSSVLDICLKVHREAIILEYAGDPA